MDWLLHNKSHPLMAGHGLNEYTESQAQWMHSISEMSFDMDGLTYLKTLRRTDLCRRAWSVLEVSVRFSQTCDGRRGIVTTARCCSLQWGSAVETKHFSLAYTLLTLGRKCTVNVKSSRVTVLFFSQIIIDCKLPAYFILTYNSNVHHIRDVSGKLLQIIHLSLVFKHKPQKLCLPYNALVFHITSNF